MATNPFFNRAWLDTTWLAPTWAGSPDVSEEGDGWFSSSWFGSPWFTPQWFSIGGYAVVLSERRPKRHPTSIEFIPQYEAEVRLSTIYTEPAINGVVVSAIECPPSYRLKKGKSRDLIASTAFDIPLIELGRFTSVSISNVVECPTARAYPKLTLPFVVTKNFEDTVTVLPTVYSEPVVFVPHLSAVENPTEEELVTLVMLARRKRRAA